MSSDLATPSNTLVKVRWKEQYVSEGINKKLNGIIPAGVIRGGKLATSVLSLRVTLQADLEFGDSIYSYIDANGAQLTFRQVGDVTLDLTALAGQTVYVALYIDFTVSSSTVVKWRAYTEAELFGGGPVPEADYVVVLGRVVVPGAGVIPAANITPKNRRESWQVVSPTTREAYQVVSNGDFEYADAHKFATLPDDDIQGWRADFWTPSGLEFYIDETNPHRGSRCFKILGNAPNNDAGSMLGDRYVAVRPGQVVRAAWWIELDSIVGGMGASGTVSIAIRFYTKELQYLAGSIKKLCEVGLLTGSVPYQEMFDSTEVPANAAFMRYAIYAYDDTTTMSGAYYIDEVRVWVEAGSVKDDDQHRDAVSSIEALSSIDIVPRAGILSMLDQIQKTLRLEFDASSTSVLKYNWGHLRARRDWLLKLLGGGIQIDRLIEGLGSDVIVDAANAALPRIKSPIPATATARYTLLWEMDNTAGVGRKIRLYASDSTVDLVASEAFVVTVNAKWTGTQWDSDSASYRSSRFDFGSRFIAYYVRRASSSDTWTDAQWDGGVVGERLFRSGEATAGVGTTRIHGPLSYDTDNLGNIVVVPGSCFHPSINGAASDWDRLSTARLLYQNVGGAVAVFPLDRIPDFSVITEVRVWIRASNAQAWTAQLRTLYYTDAFAAPEVDTLLQSDVSPAAAGDHEIKISPIAEDVYKYIPGGMYAYYLRVISPAVLDIDNALVGAAVSYTCDEQYP